MTARPRQAAPKGRDRAEAERLNTSLLQAAHDGDTEGARAALERGADVATAHARTGLTALHLAVATNNLALARLLIEEWEAPFGADKFGRWPTVVALECEASRELSDYIYDMEAEAIQNAK